MDSPAIANLGRAATKVAEEVRGGIADGRYASGAFLPPVRALKAALAVNYNTVRRALKALEAEGVIAAEPRHGYRVLGRAHDPERGCPFAYVSWRDREGAEWDRFHQVLMSGLESAAGEKGWGVLSLGSRSSNYAEVVEQLKAAKAWGAILETSKPEFLELIERAGIPAVMVDEWREDLNYDSILQDNYRGGYLAGKELVEAGCKRIAWLGPVGRNAHSRERFGGAAAALAAAGQVIPPERCFDAWREAEEGSRPGGQDWLAETRRMLSSPQRPDGVLALWTALSVDVKTVADELGLKVGRDFRTVGWSVQETYGEFASAFAGGDVPPAVVWSVKTMAEISVKRLAERRSDRTTPPLRINVPTRLLKGE
ncbi:MAG: GntR family transcriptional regulator [Planctomycetota bacterium]|jgi:DNA-binding LacI/PurR family transcriptional regulator